MNRREPRSLWDDLPTASRVITVLWVVVLVAFAWFWVAGWQNFAAHIGTPPHEARK